MVGKDTAKSFLENMKMNEPADKDWDLLYDKFHGNNEDLKDQIDRLAHDSRTISAQIHKSQSMLVSVHDTGKNLALEAERARMAWDKSEGVAFRIAARAAKAAHSNATGAVTNVIENLNTAIGDLNKSTNALNSASLSVKLRAYIVSAIAITTSLFSFAAGMYVNRQEFKPLIYSQTQLLEKGALLDKMWFIASEKEKMILKKLIVKAQSALSN